MSGRGIRAARRLGGAAFGLGGEGFKFARIKEARRRAVEAHPGQPLIDFGIGEDAEPADPSVVSRLAVEAGLRENRTYADCGITEFQHEAARWMKATFGVSIDDPEGGILHGIGSKPILACLPAAFIDPGDVSLVTVPGYPVLADWTRYLGGRVHGLPLRRENGFFPDYGEVPESTLRKAKLLYLNYPNNPTGAAPTRALFEEAVRFASRRGILVVHDAAYAALVYGGRRPLSILSVDGAQECCLEVHSLSKAFSMTGWRLGFASGNPLAVRAYRAVKDNMDSGQFRAVQKAGIEALSRPQITRGLALKYQRRFSLLFPALRRLGFLPAGGEGGFYCYAPAPRAARDPATGGRAVFRSAEEASLFLLERALISTVPWDEVEPSLRFSVTFEAGGEEAERRVVAEAEGRLSALRLEFADS